MRSVPEFFLVALLVTLTPGPATALILRVTARDGRRAAAGAVVGNSMGVLAWGALSAVGVSSLILASELMAIVIVGYDLLWFGTLIYAVDRAGALLRPRLHRAMERITGGVLIGLGVSVAADAR